MTIEVVKEQDDFDYFTEDTDFVVIAISLGESQQRLRVAFNKLLREHHRGKKGKPSYIYDPTYQAGKRDGYELAKAGTRYGPSLRLLQNALEVYDRYEQNKSEPKSRRKYLWQLENAISSKRSKGKKLITRGLRKDPDGNDYKWRDMDRVSQRNIQAATICRYNKFARTIIAHVEKGIFPKHC